MPHKSYVRSAYSLTLCQIKSVNARSFGRLRCQVKIQIWKAFWANDVLRHGVSIRECKLGFTDTQAILKPKNPGLETRVSKSLPFRLIQVIHITASSTECIAQCTMYNVQLYIVHHHSSSNNYSTVLGCILAYLSVHGIFFRWCHNTFGCFC